MKLQRILHPFLAILFLFSFTFLLPGQPAVAQDPPPLFPAAYLPALFNQITPSAPVLQPVTGADDGSYTLSWSASTNGEPTTYIVQEAANPAFTQLVQDACNTPDLSCEITGKAAGTVYYRVRGINEYGPGTWSSTQSATVLPPGTPALSGIDNTDFDRSYTLNWTAASLADMYRLQQSSDNAFTSPTDIYTGLETTFTINDQPDGAYYYRIRAEGPTGASAWSSYRSVAILPPPAPVLSGINNSDFDRNYSLTWQSVARASSYTLEQSTDSAFTGPSVLYTGSDTTFPINNQVNGTYYYRVRGENPVGPGLWSGVQSVTILPPSAPALNPIINNDFDANYIISWPVTERAISYRLEKSTESTFTSPTVLHTGPETVFNISYQYAGTYYYRVRAENPIGAGLWSSTQSIAVLPPSAPVLFTINNSDYDLNYSVSWQSAERAVNYILEQATNSALSDRTTVYYGPETTWLITSQSSGTYYYRVRADNPVGAGAWSAVQTITIGVPSRPTLNTISNIAGNYTASWTASTRASSYTLEESSSGAFTNPVVVYSGPKLTWSKVGQTSGTYYYRVRAVNPVGPGSWSAVQSVAVAIKPQTPVLSAINNADNNNFYKLSWNAVGGGGINYVVEEANNSAFSGVRTVYKGGSTTWLAADRPFGKFYYRVKATFAGLESAWSSIQSANVPTPPAGVTVLNNHLVYKPVYLSTYFWVIGEIYNNTGSNILSAKVTVNFYNKGTLVATGYTYADISLIQRYEKAPFFIAINVPTAWDSYRFEPVSFSNTSTTRPRLTVHNTNNYISSNHIHAVGEVRNDDTVNAKDVKVHALLFDENGNILDKGSGSIYQDILAPGASSSFNIQFVRYAPSGTIYIRYQAVGSR